MIGGGGISRSEFLHSCALCAVPCVFIPGDRTSESEHRFVIWGLYPPARSNVHSQHSNRTSRGLSLIIDIQNGDWVDLLPMAPATANKELSQAELKKLVKQQDPSFKPFLLESCERTKWLVERENGFGNTLPKVFVCDETMIIVRSLSAVRQ